MDTNYDKNTQANQSESSVNPEPLAVSRPPEENPDLSRVGAVDAQPSVIQSPVSSHHEEKLAHPRIIASLFRTRLAKISAITVIASLVVIGLVFYVFRIPIPFLGINESPDFNVNIVIPHGAIYRENIFTPEEALAEARSVPGFSDEDVRTIRALLNANNEIQYWLIETRIGNITVNSVPPPPKIIIPINTTISTEAITPEEAIRRAKKIRGYENEQILEVHALVDNEGNLEYWSVKTSRGFVTVEAR